LDPKWWVWFTGIPNALGDVAILKGPYLASLLVAAELCAGSVEVDEDRGWMYWQ
jgi:hypothetical protein